MCNLPHCFCIKTVRSITWKHIRWMVWPESPHSDFCSDFWSQKLEWNKISSEGTKFSLQASADLQTTHRPQQTIFLTSPSLFPKVFFFYMKYNESEAEALTWNNEFNFFWHGSSQHIGCIATIFPLEIGDDSMVQNHKCPRVITCDYPGIR